MVASYTRLLGDRYRGQLDDKADTYIQYAVEGAERMQTLIQDLLAFSRVGRQGMDWRLTDCNLLVQEALSNLSMAIEESGATVTYGTLPKISADGPLLLQVFQNLIANAIKFHGETAPTVDIRAEKNGTEWVLSCTDNGIGISPEHAEVVFTIFKRLHTRSEYPGNGIGLSLCKRIIEHHGGTIRVESKPGEGSSFRFTLPIGIADLNSSQGMESK